MLLSDGLLVLVIERNKVTLNNSIRSFLTLKETEEK